tara:strand:- start:3504 stop:3929 length:426 start_codon:yes stop_codon:yes gene_type:complete
MNLQITPKLAIKYNEIKWRFSRSSGPGGQNINKVESQVELIFNINKSKTLNSFQKNLLFEKLNNKIINGCISIKVQEKRTQLQNRQLAIQKLISLIKSIIMSNNKVRKKTIPTKSSQKRRVDTKKKRGAIKRNRQNTTEED